jgi:hypothetical protein
MIIVNLKGGLGNQMFQYAAGRRLSEIHKTELKLDCSFLSSRDQGEHVTLRAYELSALKIKAEVASNEEVRKLKNFPNRVMSKFIPFYSHNPYVKERYFHFDHAIMTLKDNRYLDGHWMSEKYFKDIEPIIRREFAFQNQVLASAKELESRINNSNAVCIQVRRGDYVTNPNVAKVHGATSMEYYNNAIAFVQNKIKDPVFFVFSDDSNWCVENFKGLSPAFFVEKELENSTATNSDYLQLMKQCKHFVISNSTFAWWGAWLSDHRDKTVIAPREWFSLKSIRTEDIYPEAWQKI